MVTTNPHPRLDLALPGVWAQCPVGDREREERLLELLRQSGPDGARAAEEARAQLDRLAAMGGDQVFLRQDEAALLTVAWPPALPSPAIFAGGQSAIESLRREAGGEAAEVRSRHHFHVVRAERGEGAMQSSTYWIAHPVSARLLVVDVTVWSGDRRDLAVYDSMAGSISWTDTDPLGR